MGLSPRDAQPSDYAAFVRLFPVLDVPDPTPTEERYRTLIMPNALFLWEDERAIGYAFWHAFQEHARISHVIVEPSAQGRGVGAALMREVGARARRAGCSHWTLNVKPGNVPAIRLYEKCGMRTSGRMTALQIAWSDIARLPRGAGMEPFLVTPEEEAEVEVATGLFPGQLGALRRGGGRVFVGLREAEAVVGVAAFDPSFPGAMPFRAKTTARARELFEGMRPHARPEHASVRFVADDAAIVAATCDVGAEILLETLQMEGPIAV